MLIAIIGAGWSGCHIACELAEEGHQVVLLDRERQVFGGTSGSFGIRLHRGPHYPRSKATRENCQKTFDRFRETYKELVIDHEYAIYANGTIDSEGFPSKVSDDAFEKVCMETAGTKKIDPATYGLAELGCAYDLDEPSIAIGTRARSHFEKKLSKLGVNVVLNAGVLEIQQTPLPTKSSNTGAAITFQINTGGFEDQSITHTFVADVAINCTGFQSFLPKAVSNPASPVHFDFVYQVCLALRFTDNAPTSNKPISFIVMDGWFPCLMPAIADEKDESTPQRDYILTHGAYTILGSFDNPREAKQLLYEELTDDFINAKILNPAVSQMKRFWTGFSDRFTYQGWYGSVLAKPKCPTEFRSSFTFENEGIIHVFPGKVSNVFDASDEVITLLQTKGSESKDVIEHHGSRFLADGVFGASRTELRRQVSISDRSTSSLQTFQMIAANA